MVPKVSSVRQIAISVRDVPVALSFYRGILGLEFLFQPAEQLAFLDAAGVRIMLTQPQGAGEVGKKLDSLFFCRAYRRRFRGFCKSRRGIGT